ncbi:MAG: hypothetical protein WA323_06940 [Candidatus Nitrosopolaris sp.]|jgi:hypothetical protein
MGYYNLFGDLVGCCSGRQERQEEEQKDGGDTKKEECDSGYMWYQ